MGETTQSVWLDIYIETNREPVGVVGIVTL